MFHTQARRTSSLESHTSFNAHHRGRARRCAGVHSSGAGPDPIFAAIEAHRTAETAFSDCVLKKDRWEGSWNLANPGRWHTYENHPEHVVLQGHVDATCDAAYDARMALIEMVPTTLAGLAALLAYLRSVAGHMSVTDNDEEWNELLFSIQHAV